MFNDRWEQQRLESPLFGALVHAVEMGTAGVDAELAGGRLYGVAADQPTAYVSTAGLTADAATRASIQHWPTMRDSIFHALSRLGRPASPGVFRPHELLDEPTHSASPLYHCVRQLCRVVDAIGARCELPGHGHALLLFFRCDGSLPFRRNHLERLSQLHAGLTATLTRGCFQLQKPPAPATPARPVSVMELLERLSATERQVLAYLRQQHTEAGVAARIHRSRHTVHVHVKSIYRKLDVNSRAELLQLLETADLADPTTPATHDDQGELAGSFAH